MVLKTKILKKKKKKTGSRPGSPESRVDPLSRAGFNNSGYYTGPPQKVSSFLRVKLKFLLGFLIFSSIS
jgi:hypothetical protein